MQRLLTAAVLVPLALLAVFQLPSWAWLAIVLAVLVGAAIEFVRVARSWAPDAPLAGFPVLMVVASVALAYHEKGGPHGPAVVWAFAALVTLGFGSFALLARTPPAQSLPALGALAFGVPYFALPAAAIYRLHVRDPWLVILLFAIVWLGDTAAYYVGSRFGRHKMAPVVSPKKSWEGAIAGLAVSLLATVAWALLRRPEVGWGELLVIAAATAVAAQLADLVESLLKRGAGIKDSGNLLPGHGGLLDRVDALLFGAPVLLAGIWYFGGGW
ncbi:MAG: phosphatidate cytidylyltransferase [Thermoanaerobaculia bacterium]|nr:phosphatidate cytidylyltransferase [Thermoanaerobaculia bacterium]